MSMKVNDATRDNEAREWYMMTSRRMITTTYNDDDARQHTTTHVNARRQRT